MDISNVDLRPGLSFSNKVRSLLGARVSARSSSASSCFWLLASFSRSKIKLSESNVAFLLQSVLGGSSDLFQVSEVDAWIFKFCVSCKEVGLLIYQMGSSQCDFFKVDFNLFNDRGLHFAKLVIANAQGAHFPWISVSSRKSPVLLTGANSLPLGRSKFRRCSSPLQKLHDGCSSVVDVSDNRRTRSKVLDGRARTHEQRTQKFQISNQTSRGINLDLNLGAMKNPSSSFGPSLELADLQEAFMAYRFVNPAPFMPRGCQRQIVGFRKPMSRVVLGGARRNQSDVAIAKIEPLPQLQVSFQSIRELLDDFLRNHKGLTIHSIQPCPYGQAYVRFHFVHEKDFLIGGGQHQYGQYRITFSDHNRGWNNRLTTMNCEAWVMLLGLNIDYWTKSDIEKAVAVFGRLLVWEEDPNNLARVIVKVRVVDLTEIPWFLVCSEGEDFEGNSWTVQCEILQYRLLGVGPEDENQPPDEVDPLLFDFFGYGQPSNAGNHNVPGAMPVQAPAQQWGLWPEGPQGQNDAPFIGPQLPPDVPIVQGLPANQEQQVPPQEDNLDALVQEVHPNGGIDNLIQAAANQGADDHMEDNMQIIDGTDSSGSEGHPPHNFNIEPPQVDVFIPQDNGQPLHMVQEEINENELLDGNQDQDQALDQGPQNFNMQLGFVQTLGPCRDPVFSQFQNAKQLQTTQTPADLYNLWAKYLPPGKTDSQVNVPLSWSHFFMAQLLNPMSFAWAKSFLSSPAMSFLYSEPALKVSLPNVCPNEMSPDCPSKDSSNQNMGFKSKGIIFEGNLHSDIASSSTIPFAPDVLEQNSPDHDVFSHEPTKSPSTPLEKIIQKVSATSGPWSKALLKKAHHMNDLDNIDLGCTVNDEELRRSSRNSSHNQGYKSSSCKNKNCIGCSAAPPALSRETIRNLGESFCKVEASKLTSDVLVKKKGTAPVARKLVKKKSAADAEDAQEPPRSNKKKPKKQ
uniref:DUF7597 domain-containing protein n=1 Tax=Setaria viridis TaxID=4556 RepID=A0A4U6VYN9_SETVI|nr:hypothetical protein SEVIR_2G016600v2 [Setaria viridis]